MAFAQAILFRDAKGRGRAPAENSLRGPLPRPPGSPQSPSSEGRWRGPVRGNQCWPMPSRSGPSSIFEEAAGVAWQKLHPQRRRELRGSETAKVGVEVVEPRLERVNRYAV